MTVIERIRASLRLRELQQLLESRRWLTGIGVVCFIAAAVLARPPARQPWQDLLQPLDSGGTVAGDYVLEPPRAGHEGDVVFVARRDHPPAKVEVHVVPRGLWAEGQKTPSFGVAYEIPTSTAPTNDCEAVTRAIADAVRRNDPGGLSLSAFELNRGLLERTVASLGSIRGQTATGVVCIGLAALARGTCPLAPALVVFLIGLALRATRLDLPFDRDQDIQRAFTGHLPVLEILTGMGLEDRHPPLYFLVLHVAQWFGQSEAIVRWPAVIAGSLVGPSLYVIFTTDSQRQSATLTFSALALAISPALIQVSREVSQIPLFALLAFGAVAMATRSEGVTRRSFVAIAAIHALMFWTYHVALIVVTIEVLTLLVAGRRHVLRPIAAGALLGSPALLHGLVTFIRDRPARLAAGTAPELAWGERDAVAMGAAVLRVVRDCFGEPLLAGAAIIAIGAIAWGCGTLCTRVAALVLIGTVATLSALAPWARLQPYYVMTVAPLIVLQFPASAGTPARFRWVEPLVATFLLLSITFGVAPRLARSLSIWQAPRDAFGPVFAEAIDKLGRARVITVMHYDATLLAWYLARRAGNEVDWNSLRVDGHGRINSPAFAAELVPVMYAHSSNASDVQATRTIERVLGAGGAVVLHRPGLPLPAVTRRLERCVPMVRAGSAELRWCR